MENKYCFLSYLSNDRDYKGALMLNYMLKKYNSRYNLACILLENVSKKVEDVLQKSGIIIYNYHLLNSLKNFNFNEEYIEYLINKNYYGKFLIYNLTMYDKIIYLDTDLLIKGNIDHLFDYDCSDNKCYMTYDLQYNYETKDVILLSNCFNSGVIIFTPNNEICNNLYNKLKIFDDMRHLLSTDQDIFKILNDEKNINVQHLNYIYNCPAIISHYFISNNFIENPMIIHFTLSPKPWDFIDFTNDVLSNKFNSDTKNYFIEWCNLYNEMVMEILNKSYNLNIFVQVNEVYLKEKNDNHLKQINNEYKF